MNGRVKTWYGLFFAMLVIRLGTPVYTLYRPYETHHPGSRSAMMGNAGAAMTSYAQTVAINPALAVYLPGPVGAIGVYGRSALSQAENVSDISLGQLPMLAISSPIAKNIRVGLIHYTGFERAIPRLDFSQYNLEFYFAYRYRERIALAVGTGLAIGYQVPDSLGYGISSSWGALYRHPFADFAFVFRPGPQLKYKQFLTVGTVRERMPPRAIFGINKKWEDYEFAVDVEYIFWQYIFFEEAGTNVAPDVSHNIENGLQFHAGFSYPLYRVPGLRYGAGAYQIGTYDFEGQFQRNWHVTTGAYLSAVTGQGKNRFQVGFTLISSLIPALIEEREKATLRNQNERIYLTFEFSYQ